MTAAELAWLTATRPAWIEQAECRGHDTALFFVGSGTSTTRARAICARCTVRAECLDMALSNSELFGVWGGVGTMKRRELRRDRRHAARL